MELQFYKILKQLRTEKELSQFKLAKALNCSQSIITKWELNQREPTAQALISISKFFNVTMEYLLGLEDEYGNKLYNEDVAFTMKQKESDEYKSFYFYFKDKNNKP